MDIIEELEFDPAEFANSAKDLISSCLIELDRDGIVLGLSGGLDSAVIATLCKEAIGADKILLLIMPERDSDKQNINDAIEFASNLGLQYKIIKITPFIKKFGVYRSFFLNRLPVWGKLRSKISSTLYNHYKKKTAFTPFESGLTGIKKGKYSKYLKGANAYYRIKHRIRMLLLYKYAELENRLVVGAANKSELMTGFFVKHGCDHAVDVMPILSLYKTQVKELAKHLKIPKHFITKSPSPDIVPGITDEQAMGISYNELDKILYLLEQKVDKEKIAKQLHVTQSKVSHVERLIKKSEHMRKIYDLGFGIADFGFK